MGRPYPLLTSIPPSLFVTMDDTAKRPVRLTATPFYRMKKLAEHEAEWLASETGKPYSAQEVALVDPEELAQLRADSAELARLEAAGVDSWESY